VITDPDPDPTGQIITDPDPQHWYFTDTFRPMKNQMVHVSLNSIVYTRIEICIDFALKSNKISLEFKKYITLYLFNSTAFVVYLCLLEKSMQIDNSVTYQILRKTYLVVADYV